MPVTFKGEPVRLDGNVVNVGDIAPVVNVTGCDLGNLQIGGKQGVTQVIIAVPSLDTGVCAASARKFNEQLSGLKNAHIVVVSMDLVFAMGRFCSSEGIVNLSPASDFKQKAFARSYGLLIGDGVLEGLMCRAVFVINKDGIVTFKQIVDEIMDEPDYEAVLDAANAASF